MNKVLVLGGSGLLGRAISSELKQSSDFQVYTTHFENPMPLEQDKSFKLNIKDSDSINSILDIIKPQIIVSCLRGDYDKQLISHRKIAEYLKINSGRLYFCSTTNVFDNDLSKPHYEDEPPSSCTDYGQYKIECEKIILEILHDNAVILRLPQVWGKNSSRLNYLLGALANNERVVVYPRLFLNTNTDVVIAKQLSHIITHGLNGIFHLVANDVISHEDFNKELIIKLGFNNARIEENLEEEGYFAILSRRHNEFPGHLRLTNRLVINYLTA